MRAYCDTSVLADLLLDAEGSRAARDILMDWQSQGTAVTSRVTTVELGRLVMRTGLGTGAMRLNMGGLPLAYVGLGEVVLRRAATLPVQFLRSLDAIHVSTALLTHCDVVLTRDRQMARACEELGLAVA